MDDQRRHDDVPHLGPLPQRVDVDVTTVQRLVAEQHPQWSHLPVAAVPDGGWDNWTYRLGDDFVVRLPSAAEYAQAVAKERRWLPWLAPRLPIEVPERCADGVPGAGYPFPWSVYRWIDGEAVTSARTVDLVDLAEDLAEVLVSLRGLDASGGPQPGVHCWYRGGTLRIFDVATRVALDRLAPRLDVSPLAELWETALSAPWDGVDVWFHGDLAAGNLLHRDGRLAALIDFGTCGVGDPSCDLAVAWTLLDASARETFRRRVEVDDDEWVRGQGWALWKALGEYERAVSDGDIAAAAAPARVLSQLVRQPLV